MQRITKENQEVFDYIATLLVADDFKNAQLEFYNQNCSHFENEDENKHIYQTIYKEYAHILDQSIESQLQEKFPETQINSFFESFSDNYKLYTDQDTVDTLFTFTDFENFKKTLVDYNLRITNKKMEDLEENPKSQKDFDMSTYDEIYNTPLSKFKQILKGKTDKDISLYTIKFGNTGLDMVRVHFYLKDCTIEALNEKMINVDFEEIMKTSKELKIGKYLKKDSINSNYSYCLYDMPMMSEREYLTHNQYFTRGDQHIISCRPVELPEAPITNKTIRGEYHKTAYAELVPGTKDIRVVSLEVYDMKGYIPKMFMNLMMGKIAKLNTEVLIQGIREKQAQLDGKK